jgi:hypothetical protein
MPSCGDNCRFFTLIPNAAGIPFHDGIACITPFLVRQVQIICLSCDSNVSDNNHLYCYKCAIPNTIEFYYHHQRCIQPQEQQQN